MLHYDISQNDFSQRINEKIRQYSALMSRAEMVRRDHQNRRSKEEAKLYLQAAGICTEIMNMNQSEHGTYSKWNRLKAACEEQVREIARVLSPEPPSTQSAAGETDFSGLDHPAAPRRSRGMSPRPAAEEEGFVTRNATRDVPKEVIRSWYKDIPARTFEDIVGMDDIRSLLEQKMNLKRYKRTQDCLGLESVESFVFYGLPGTGKTSVIEAFAHELMEEENFQFIHLTGSDILDSLVGVAEKKVAAAFQEAIDHASCIIFIDELDNVCVSRTKPNVASHQKSLTVAFMEAYNHLKNAGRQVVFIGATNHPEEIDKAMLDRITLVKVPLPNAQAREQYFGRKLRKFRLEEGLTLAQMAEQTEGYSFRDLDRLTQALVTEFGEQTIQENRRIGEDGVEDREATDIAGAHAIETGEAVLTKVLFDEKCGAVASGRQEQG